MPADSAVLEVPDETVIGEQIVTIKTNVAEITFTNRGGDIISYKLLEHNNSKGDSHVEMVKNLTDRNRAFSIALGGAQAPALNQFFNVKEETVNGKQTVGFFKTISIKNQDGSISSFTLAKRYTFLPDDYMFELAVTVSGDADMTLRRRDTGKAARVAFNGSVVPFAPEMRDIMPQAVAGMASPEELQRFGELWQARVHAILVEQADNPEMIVVQAAE